MTVLAPGREFKVLAENKFASGFMASPAVSGKGAVPPHARRTSIAWRSDPAFGISP